MLLRRVIEHVREQNLTAIAIDFVIVVVGVFVGILGSNWNAERADRERGAQFAERLADLETRMVDFTGNNREVFQALHEVTGDAP